MQSALDLWAVDLYANPPASRPASSWACPSAANWATCGPAPGLGPLGLVRVGRCCTCRPACPAAGCSPEPAAVALLRRSRLAVRAPRPGVPRAAPPRAAARPLGSRELREPAGRILLGRGSLPRSSTRAEAEEGKSEFENRAFNSKLLAQISTVSNEISGIDPWLLNPTDPRRNSRNGQGSITNRAKNQNLS